MWPCIYRRHRILNMVQSSVSMRTVTTSQHVGVWTRARRHCTVPRHATPRVINNRQKIPRIVYAVPMNLRIGANVPVLSTKYRRVRHHSYLALETMQTEHYCHLFRVNFIAAMVILRHDVMNLDVNFYHGFFNTLLDFF